MNLMNLLVICRSFSILGVFGNDFDEMQVL
jgi:hypothetical protein